MIYIRKLLDLYGPDTLPKLDYARRCIVPRFMPMLVQEYQQALETDDEAALRVTTADLQVLLRFLPFWIRTRMQAIRPIMERRPLARLIQRVAKLELPFVTRAIPRVFR